MTLFEKYQSIIENAVAANRERKFYAQYPEHPKPYGEEAPVQGKQAFEAMLNNPFGELLQENAGGLIGEEESPYWQKGLGITYPSFSTEDLVGNAKTAFQSWKKVSPGERAGLLVDALENVTCVGTPSFHAYRKGVIDVAPAVAICGNKISIQFEVCRDFANFRDRYLPGGPER